MGSTGENEKGLKDILDFTRLAAIAVLLIHFYYYCYGAFFSWHLSSGISERLLENISHTGLFKSIFYSKLIALALLIISLMGVQGKKDEKIRKDAILFYLLTGFLLYFLSQFLLDLNYTSQALAIIYI